MNSEADIGLPGPKGEMVYDVEHEPITGVWSQSPPLAVSSPPEAENLLPIFHVFFK